MGEGTNKISWHNAKLAMSVRGKNKHYGLKDIQLKAPPCSILSLPAVVDSLH